jgi:glycerate kinase
MVGLHVRHEDRHDRSAESCGRGEVVADEVVVRVDDRQLSVGGAAEQVAGTGAGA